MAEGAPESNQLTKYAINSVLGLWSTPQRYVYTVETTSCNEDLLCQGDCRKRAVPGHDTLYDYIFETPLKTCASMRPIQQIVLDMELVYISMNYRTIRRFCEPKQITALFTDAIHCYPSRCQRDKLKLAAEQLCHPDGSAIFRLRDAEPKVVCTTEAPVTEPFSISPDERPWTDYEADEVLRLVENGESVSSAGTAARARLVLLNGRLGASWQKAIG